MGGRSPEYSASARGELLGVGLKRRQKASRSVDEVESARLVAKACWEEEKEGDVDAEKAR